MRFDLQPLDPPSALAILAWRYERPYDLYDGSPEDPAALAALLDPANRYHAAFAEGALAGFCCFGPDARVPGGGYDDDDVDVGAGLRPDLTGRGSGAAFLRDVVALGERLAGGARLRATVAAFNRRAQRACARVGFAEVARFRRPGDGAEFAILLRRAST